MLPKALRFKVLSTPEIESLPAQERAVGTLLSVDMLQNKANSWIMDSLTLLKSGWEMSVFTQYLSQGHGGVVAKMLVEMNDMTHKTPDAFRTWLSQLCNEFQESDDTTSSVVNGTDESESESVGNDKGMDDFESGSVGEDKGDAKNDGDVDVDSVKEDTFAHYLGRDARVVGKKYRSTGRLTLVLETDERSLDLRNFSAGIYADTTPLSRLTERCASKRCFHFFRKHFNVDPSDVMQSDLRKAVNLLCDVVVDLADDGSFEQDSQTVFEWAVEKEWKGVHSKITTSKFLVSACCCRLTPANPLFLL